MRMEQFVEQWIDYPVLGRIGFVVQRRDGLSPPNQLTPKLSDFVMLR
jgi:hypothetical protein